MNNSHAIGSQARHEQMSNIHDAVAFDLGITRDTAKTWFYASNYNVSNEALETLTTAPGEIGRILKAVIMKTYEEQMNQINQKENK